MLKKAGSDGDFSAALNNANGWIQANQLHVTSKTTRAWSAQKRKPATSQATGAKLESTGDTTTRTLSEPTPRKRIYPAIARRYYRTTDLDFQQVVAGNLAWNPVTRVGRLGPLGYRTNLPSINLP